MAEFAIGISTNFPASVGSRNQVDVSPSLLAPDARTEVSVRALPLRTPGGRLALALDESSAPSESELLDIADQLARRLSLDAPLQVWKSFAVPLSGQVNPDGSYAYLYLKDMITPALRDLRRRQFPDLLDLTSTLIVADLMYGEFTVGSPMGFAGIAYELLDSSRFRRSCDLSTNLAFLVGKGVGPFQERVDVLTDRASRACGSGDPTPAWARAMSMAAHERVGGVGELDLDQVTSRESPAFDAFRDLATAFPSSPMGLAGQADLLLRWASTSESRGWQPFQARAWRVEALNLIRQARTFSADPRLLVAEARALAGTADPSDALRLLKEAEEAMGPYLPARVLRSNSLTGESSAEEALESVRSEATAPIPWWATPPRFPELSSNYVDGIYGAEEYPPGFIADASLLNMGGAYVDDYTLIPISRSSEPDAGCWGARVMERMLLAGRNTDLLDEIESGLDPTQGWASGLACGDAGLPTPDLYRAMAVAAEEGADYQGGREFGSVSYYEAFDALQDLFRRAGRLDDAAEVTGEWLRDSTREALPHQRLGEILFRAGDHKGAAEQFAMSRTMLQEAPPDLISGPTEPGYAPPSVHDAYVLSTLSLGAALLSLGDEDAESYLQEGAVQSNRHATITDNYDGIHLLAAYTLLGTESIREEDWATAVERFLAADQAASAMDGGEVPPRPSDARNGALENNLALAYTKLNEVEAAQRFASAAVALDPRNPVYLDTAGFVVQGTGDERGTQAAYELALRADATSFVSAMNSAVALAWSGDRASAIHALCAIVADYPDYALAWHNLGVLWQESANPLSWIQGEGAAAKARQLEPALKENAELLYDEDVYASGLDISQVNAESWRYGSSASAVSQRTTWTVLVLIGLRVLWALGLDRVTGGATGRLLTSKRLPARLRTRTHAVWAVVACVAVMSGASVLSHPQWMDLWVTAALGGLVLLPLLVRHRLATRAHVELKVETWSPAVVVGAGTATIGFPYAPYPVLNEAVHWPRQVRWSAPITMAVILTIAFIVSWTTAAPTTSALSANALLLLASVLVPIRPLDGAELAGRMRQFVLTSVLALGTVVLALNWV